IQKSEELRTSLWKKIQKAKEDKMGESLLRDKTPKRASRIMGIAAAILFFCLSLSSYLIYHKLYEINTNSSSQISNSSSQQIIPQNEREKSDIPNKIQKKIPKKLPKKKIAPKPKYPVLPKRRLALSPKNQIIPKQPKESLKPRILLMKKGAHSASNKLFASSQPLPKERKKKKVKTSGSNFIARISKKAGISSKNSHSFHKKKRNLKKKEKVLKKPYLAAAKRSLQNKSRKRTFIKPKLLGDLNHNGKLDVGDAMLLTKFILHLSKKQRFGISFDGFAELADFNQDGQINIVDSMTLTRKLVELQSK
ncbi:MAG: hypothetical protein D6785_07600, partial [Planctomycetota bacterium]